MTPTLALLILAWVAIVLLALALGGVVAQQRALHAIVTRQPVNTGQTPIVGQLVNQDGQAVAPPYAALFVTPDCSTCQTVVPAVVQATRGQPDRTVPVLVVSDRPYPRAKLAGLNSVTWIVEDGAAERFGIPAFPWLVVVDADGDTIHHDVAHNPDDVATRISNTSSTPSVEKGATS